MVKIENHIGNIIISEKYLRQIIENAVKECFGVAGICSATPAEIIASKLGLAETAEGIAIYVDDKGRIIVKLHIEVAFGININAVVKSVTHKVSFIIEEALGNVKYKVNVFVDSVKS